MQPLEMQRDLRYGSRILLLGVRMRPIPSEIEELELSRQVLLRACKSLDSTGMIPFFTAGGEFVARPLLQPNRSNPGNPTAACFSYYMLRKSGALRQPDKKFVPTIAKGLELLAQGSGSRTETQELPNTYNTPILLSGVLHAVRDGLLPASTTDALDESLAYVVERLHSNGFLEAVGSGDYSDGKQPTSAFSTFWGIAALREASALGLAIKNADEAFIKAGQWAQSAAAEATAWHFAGVPSRFEPDDAICAAAITYACNKEPDAHKLADKAVAVALESYSRDGQLTKSRAVFSTDNNRVVTMSTYEASAYLLAFASLQQTRPQAGWRSFAAVARRAEEAWQPGRGIANDQDARTGILPEPTAFSTAAAIASIHFALGVVEAELDVMSKKELGVPPAEPKRADKSDYAPNLEKVINQFIVGKVDSASPDARKNAFYSMIWFGPPGTGKTSSAKALARSLGWSFVQITLKDFLTDGSQYMDAAAERVFRLLLNIRDTVVLFDELEELVQERKVTATPETRRLTTSMLPRIHDLRDRENVVFIFATNILHSMDGAATRLGRFDAVVGLPPPGEAARKRIFNDLVSSRLTKNEDGVVADSAFNGVLERLSKIVEKRFLKRGMIFKDIEFVVKQIATEARIIVDSKSSPDDDALEKMLADICQNCITISSADLDVFAKGLKDSSRPNLEVLLN